MRKEQLLNFEFEWEALNKCPLCGHRVLIPSGKVSWLSMEFWYVICVSCGIKFMNPRPTQTSYRHFYKDYFWQQKERNLGFHQSGQIWGGLVYKWSTSQEWSPEEGTRNIKEMHRELRVDSILDGVSKFIEIDSETAILEVGAGYGVTLDEINRRFGSTVYAIEPSEVARKFIQELDVSIVGYYAEELRDLSNEELKYDCIIFSHSLENTTNPLGVITWARKCLKEKGIIYVQCANLHTFDQMNPYHPYIFSEYSLSYLGEKAGFTTDRLDKDHTHRMLTMIFHQQH